MKTWPNDAPVCDHIFWGTVTIVGVERSSVVTMGIERQLVEVCADQLRNRGHRNWPYATHAWLEHLTPRTAAARDMLAERTAEAKP